MNEAEPRLFNMSTKIVYRFSDRQTPTTWMTGLLLVVLAVTLSCNRQPQGEQGDNEVSKMQSSKQPHQKPAATRSVYVPHLDGYVGEVDDAIRDYTEAIEQGDSNGYLHAQRAVAWHTKGDYAKAVKDFQAALRIEPNEPTRHRDFAWLLATCPDEQYRDGQQAIEHAILYFEVATKPSFEQPGNYREHGDKAIRIAVSKDQLGGGMASLFFKGWNWQALETMAAAFAEAGEFGRAAKWQQLALTTFVRNGQPMGHLTDQDIKQMNDRLSLYLQDQTLRVETRARRQN